MSRISDKSNILDEMLNVNIDLANGGFDYFGWMRKDGAWVIQKSTTSTGAVTLYEFGSKDYATAWTNRTSLTYGYPTIS